MLARESLDLGCLLRHLGRVPVHLYQQEGFHVQGQTDRHVLFHAPNGHAIEEFQGAGNNLVADDLGNGPSRVRHALEVSDHRLLRRRRGYQLQVDRGNDPQRPLGTYEEILQREAGHVFDALGTRVQDLAVGENDLKSHDVVAGDAVFQPPQSARIIGHIAADGGYLDRPRIGGIEQTGRRRRVSDALSDHSGLHHHGEVSLVHFNDAIHAHQAEDDAAFDRHRAPRQTRAGTSCDHR